MKLRKRYTIEYIDNERDLRMLDSGTHPAPWELFKKEIIEEKTAHSSYTGADGIDGTAWKRFILWSICPDQIYISNTNSVTHPMFCQMWMELLDENGNVVYEDLCELPATTKHTFFTVINNQINKERDAAIEKVATLAKEIDMYSKFIKRYHAEKTFDEFRRENANDR